MEYLKTATDRHNSAMSEYREIIKKVIETESDKAELAAIKDSIEATLRLKNGFKALVKAGLDDNSIGDLAASAVNMLKEERAVIAEARKVAEASRIAAIPKAEHSYMPVPPRIGSDLTEGKD